MRTKGLSFKHLDFIPGKQVHEELPDQIFVFTHRRNGKIRKKKVDCVGRILKHPITKKMVFAPQPEWSFTSENMTIIAAFMTQIETKKVKLCQEEGELEVTWKN
jgi:hypothetical protein